VGARRWREGEREGGTHPTQELDEALIQVLTLDAAVVVDPQVDHRVLATHEVRQQLEHELARLCARPSPRASPLARRRRRRRRALGRAAVPAAAAAAARLVPGAVGPRRRAVARPGREVELRLEVGVAQAGGVGQDEAVEEEREEELLLELEVRAHRVEHVGDDAERG